ncbi:hypothetical protein [Nonomuraea sp. NPDC048826]|uniref:hypothetical protein n=1 Tax=Nonomuraea sp. NPDC048826 TaxID=3364347 RepID=UPI0037246D96
MKRTLQAAAGAGLALATLLATPAAASAHAGVDVKTYKVPNLQYPASGPARAQLRDITVTWRRDRVDRRTWVTVSGRLRDSGPGDGYCARFRLRTAISSWEDAEALTKECQGVWRSKSLALEPGSGGMVFVALYTKPDGDSTDWALRDPWQTWHDPY